MVKTTTVQICWMVKTTSLQIFFDGYVLTKNVDDKVHSFCKQCLHKYLVFLNMSALGSLERFGEAGVPCFLTGCLIVKRVILNGSEG